jgi:secreted trypsin-like serine protease
MLFGHLPYGGSHMNGKRQGLSVSLWAYHGECNGFNAGRGVYQAISFCWFLALFFGVSTPSALSESLRPQIVGGYIAEVQRPWMAALVASQNENLEEGFFCGGSLIHPQWVLTAAHCVENQMESGTLKPEALQVVLGTSDLNDLTNAIQVPVLEIILHPDGEDLALLLLAWPVEDLVPVGLTHDASLTAPRKEATILGWGATSEGFSVSAPENPPHLREARVPLVSNRTANASYGYAIGEGMMAAGYLKGRVDTCWGDSGGPLLVMNEEQQAWMLAGVTSFGNGCGRPSGYGIYVRVSAHYDWILQHIYPVFFEWQSTHKVRGMWADTDGDGWHNLAEFAFSSDPLSVDSIPQSRVRMLPATQGEGLGMRIGMEVPEVPEGVHYHFLQSRDLVTWQAVPREAVLQQTVTDHTSRPLQRYTLPVVNNVDGTQFFQMHPKLSRGLWPFKTVLNPWSSMTLRLLPDIQVIPDSAFPAATVPGRILVLNQLKKGALTRVRVSSDTVSPVIALIDSDEQVLATSDIDPVASDRAFLEFTADSTNKRMLRVHGANGKEGSLSVTLWQLPDRTLALDQKKRGSLSQSDPMLDHVYGSRLPTDSYLFSEGSLGEAFHISVQTSQSSYLDTALVVLDAHTGELLASNDDADGHDPSLTLAPGREGEAWIIHVLSPWGGTGSYTLSIEASEALPQDGGSINFLEVGSKVGDGVLEDEDSRYISFMDFEPVPDRVADVFEIQGWNTGDPLIIRLESPEFDAKLEVIDGAQYGLGDPPFPLVYNDDFDSELDAQVAFIAPATEGFWGVEKLYAVATSSMGGERGTYVLSVQKAPTVPILEATASPLVLDEAWSGKLSKGDDLIQVNATTVAQGDLYFIEAPATTGMVTLTMEASKFNPHLRLLDPETGIVLDESQGDFMEPNALIQYNLAGATAGVDLLVLASASSNTFGETLGTYRLRLVEGVPLPIYEPKVLDLEGGLDVSAQIEVGDDTLPNQFLGDVYLAGATEHPVRWQVEMSERNAFEIDTMLFLANPETGQILAENDDFGAMSAGVSKSQLDFFTSPNGEGAHIWASSFFGQGTGAYRITSKTEIIPMLQMGDLLEGDLVRGTLDPNYVVYDQRYSFQDYWIEASEDGRKIRVDIRSDSFLPEVYVMKAPLQEILAWTLPVATESPYSSTLEYALEPKQAYILRATSMRQNRGGEYLLKVTSPAVDPVE